MKTLVTIVLTLLLPGLLAAAYFWSGRYNIGADDPHTPATRALLEMVRERSIETRSAEVAPPDLTRAELIRSGAGNYDAMCTGCHLAPGMDETELSKGLYPKPPDFSKTSVIDPARAFWAIKHGIKASGMPAWGKSMEDEYVWGMVAFLRQLPDMDAGEYAAAVAASAGHSHGGGEMESEEHAHGGAADHHDGADHHGAEEVAAPVEHTHADGTQHVHAAAASSPVEVARLFQEALSSGDAAKVKALLDPKVLVLESGGAERSRAEYAAHHLEADMEFLKTMALRLDRQTGDTVGDLAWVASEARISGTSQGKPLELRSTETLVLKKTPAGWKIVHIHWSSQPIGKS